MGTLIHFSKMLPAYDDYDKERGSKRQVEVFSRNERLFLRIGHLDEEDMGEGYTIELHKHTAKELLEGLESGMMRVHFM